MSTSKGIAQLKKDEGFTPKASHLKLQNGKDEKIRTIGYGYNINAAADPRADLVASGVPEDVVDDVLAGKMAITEDQGNVLFNISVDRAISAADRVIPNFAELDPELRDVFINMAYQLGATGLKDFKKMRANLAVGDYKGVAREIVNSKFAKRQATGRAARLASQVITVGKRIEKENPPPKQVKAEEILKQNIVDKQSRRVAAVLSPDSKARRVAQVLSTMTSPVEDKPNTDKGSK